MEINTFDEGIVQGGIRTKTEIRTLICYLISAVNKPMTKGTVLDVIQKKGLANYFETSACFDDLVRRGNLELVDKENNLYFTTVNGKTISDQLEFNLPLTVRERAYNCAMELLEQERKEKENIVSITNTENGYNVNCRISGGDFDLMSFDFYAPDKNMARLIKKNFQKNPEAFYGTMIALVTRDKTYVKDALEQIDNML